MSWHKRLMKAERTQAILSWVLMMYIRLVFAASRIERHIEPAALPYMNGEANAIFAFWHGRMMMMLPFRPRGRNMHVLSTAHRDGQLSSRIVRLFGNYTIYGSSSHGGMSAVREMLRALKNGDNISITPEGPRGPMQVVQKGVIAIAKLSGKPVLPVTFSAVRHKRFNSWDSLMMALPFGRIVFAAAAPIFVARDADDAAEEIARETIERVMNALVKKADEMTCVTTAS
jgi:lysophospholipid acyltransferase (LPLAT)-like uncharacterized protein